MAGRHAKQSPMGGLLPIAGASVLVVVACVGLLLADSEDDLRWVAAAGVLAAAVPLLLLARTERRVDLALADHGGDVRRAAHRMASVATSTDSGLTRLNEEVDRLAAEVARLREQLARQPIGGPVMALPATAGQQPVVVNLAAPAPVVVQAAAPAAPVMASMTTTQAAAPRDVAPAAPIGDELLRRSLLDMPLVRQALRDPLDNGASERVVREFTLPPEPAPAPMSAQVVDLTVVDAPAEPPVARGA